MASILLIPGYVGVSKTERLCRFITECDITILTVLLGFYPHQYIRDLPATSIHHTYECRAAAEDTGLTKVRISNVGLLAEEAYNIK